MYPAKAHARKVRDHFLNNKRNANTAFFIAGASLKLYPYCDQTAPLRQNRYFHYLTGVNQISGCFVLYNVSTDKLTLFLPDVDADDIMWSGLPLFPEEAIKKFDVDEVLYAAVVDTVLQDLLANETEILTTDTEEYADKQFSKYVTAGDKDFFHALDEARLIKDSFELGLMRKAAKITDNSHLAVMSALPIESNEGHIHAEFVYHSIRQGSKFQAYDPICCSGPSCGTLHYVKNNQGFAGKDSVLIDAGAEWECYASDVTRCFPISGVWTKEHLEIYNAVLEMQNECMKEIKPGTHWDDLQLLAHRVLIRNFLKLGLFTGNEEDIFRSGVSASFFPHGLGHLLGMDTHDVGGNPNYNDPDPMLRYLRLRRKLEPGMVVTNEPGIYFSPLLMEPALKNPDTSKYICQEAVDKYMYIGGVRIEDDVVVTEHGHEVLTQITRDPHEIAQIVQDGLAKGRSGFHVVV
ncbi:hypothetical protein KL921_005205 [Ogataea angusta]|nr:hypothetical protein KL921_005205 [Ogataea angusta]